MFKITYKHWKRDETLEAIGTIPKELNNSNNDRLVVKLDSGQFEDVLKSTLISIEPLSNPEV